MAYPAPRNGSVTLPGETVGPTTRGNPMTLTMLAGFNAVVALALGFVLGRIWQIRRYELEQRGFATPPVARIPRA